MQVILHPRDLQNFADRLREHAGHVVAVKTSLSGGVKELHNTWRDERYRQFNNEFEATIVELEKFVQAARRYAEYLDDKALKAKMFANRSK